MPRLIPYALACLFVVGTADAADKTDYDVVIYGGTSAGVVAAVQARKMGRTAIVVGPDVHLGGLSSGGLGWTDSGNKKAVGGIGREFYQRVKEHYDSREAWRQQKPEGYSHYRPGDDAMWVFEPHVAEQVFEDFVRQYQIPVHRDRWLDREKGVDKTSVDKKNGRITAIRMHSGETYTGKIFIDATYEGDLMAAAGVSYRVGREANRVYGETLNGVQTRNARSHQFHSKIDPYVVPGDPSSGLLPRVHAGSPGVDGEGDHRVQAYNYRLCMTNDPSNRVPFPKPEGYDAAQYELLLRDLLAGSRHVFGKIDPAPNRKTDTNNHGSFSTDNIGMNYDYPEASYERRKEILAEHETYQKGYFYFLANDPRVPEDVRKRMSEWGLAKDEFLDNGHWPHQIYVREARRMVSDFVMAEPHLRGVKATPKPVGMGSYNMDSHNTQRYVAKDADGKAYVQNEGDIQVNPGGPYQISYGAIVPRKTECLNLIVPVAVSSSHIAYGSIRMEPVFMILGQSAATAAVHAIEDGVAVQDVDYAKLRERLLADGQVLDLPGGSGYERQAGLDPTKLDGVVVDNVAAKLQGSWTSSNSVAPFVGEGYLHDQNGNKGSCSARFEIRAPKDGAFEVQLAYSVHSNRASNVPIVVTHGDVSTSMTVDQRKPPAINGLFVSLEKFSLRAGQTAVVQVSNRETDGFVVVDAVRLVPLDK